MKRSRGGAPSLAAKAGPAAPPWSCAYARAPYADGGTHRSWSVTLGR